MTRYPAIVLCALLITTPALAQQHADHDHDHEHDHEHGKRDHDHAGDNAGHEHGAHVHGVAWLDVALEGSTLELRLKGTGADLAGLEGAPADAADVARVDAARRMLGDTAGMFAVQPAAACTPAAARVTPPPSALLAPGTASEAGHGDWSAEYQFSCSTPPSTLELRLFDRFGSLETVQAQILAPSGQTAAELTPGARQIDLRTAD